MRMEIRSHISRCVVVKSARGDWEMKFLNAMDTIQRKNALLVKCTSVEDLGKRLATLLGVVDDDGELDDVGGHKTPRF